MIYVGTHPILYDDRLDEKITAETWEKKHKEIVTE
jgi:hypothetical protein